MDIAAKTCQFSILRNCYVWPIANSYDEYSSDKGHQSKQTLCASLRALQTHCCCCHACNRYPTELLQVSHVDAFHAECFYL